MRRFFTVFLFLFFPAFGFAQSASLEDDIARLVEKLKPSIVTVKSEGRNLADNGANVSIFRSTLASGVVLDPEHIVTTADVEQLRLFSILSGLNGAQKPEEGLRLSVQTADGKELKAQLVASDKFSNLAVLKVEGGNLTPATFGNSDALKVGALMIIPASAMGKSSGATFGPLTDFRKDGSLLLQIPVMPGGVGGPVVNFKGEVVGLVTGQSGENLSFHALEIETQNGVQRISQPRKLAELPVSGQAIALPANQVRAVAAQLIQSKRVSRSFIGVYPQNLDEELKDYLKTDYGVLITEVASGGPAEKAGLKQEDVILSIDGRKMEDESQFRQFLNSKKPENVIKVEVLRKGRQRTFSVTLGDREDFETSITPSPPSIFSYKYKTPNAPGSLGKEKGRAGQGFLGITPADLTDEQKERFDVKEGAYIEELTENGPAEEAGLRIGDIVTAIDGRPITDAADLQEKIRRIEPGKEVPVEVLRKGGLETIQAKLADRADFMQEEESFGTTPRSAPFQIFPWNDRSAFLGVTTGPLSRRAKDSLKVDGGARVADVSDDSPASKAGLRAGDVIVLVDGEEVQTPEDLSRLIGAKKPGNSVEIGFLRRGQKKSVTAELSGRADMERTFGGLQGLDRLAPGFSPDGRDRQIEELQKQIEQLRRALDSLRQERK